MNKDLEKKVYDADEQGKFHCFTVSLALTLLIMTLACGYFLKPKKPWTKKEWREFYRVNPQIIVAVDTT